jgi:predicted methyltransferase
MDFTLVTYQKLITALQAKGYRFQTLTSFISDPARRVAIFRHDVDLLPQNALAMAKLENGMGVVATYYFRAVPESWDKSLRDG